MSSKTKITILCFLLPFLLFAAFAWWRLFTIPFSQATLQKLTPGMNHVQVAAILGPANQTNQAASEETWWIYSHSPSIRYLLIRFDSTGKYVAYVID